MNNERLSVSELIDEFYRGKITKGTILRTLENCYSNEFDTFLIYADSNYSIKLGLDKLLKTKRALYKPEKIIKPNTEKICLFRKSISDKRRTIEVVVMLFIGKNGDLKIDTQILESFGLKVKTYWISQIENFEDILMESSDLILRKIDGLFFDVKETRNEKLILTSTKQPILKRFRNLDMD